MSGTRRLRRIWFGIHGVTALALLSALTTGCGRDDSSGDPGPDPQILTQEPPLNATPEPVPTPVPTPPPTPTPEPVYAPELQGRWDSNCDDATLFGLTENATLTVNQKEMAKVTRVYSAGNCKTLAVEIHQRAAFSRGDANENGLYTQDVSITSIKIKPVSEIGVSILNLGVFCGISDWKKDEDREVTEYTGSERCYPSIPTTVFQIYSIEGTQLFFGKRTGDLTKPENRPTELDREIFYTKVVEEG